VNIGLTIDVGQLSEVVVTGYTSDHANTLQPSLQGKVSGIQSSRSRIKIRGIRSSSNNLSPSRYPQPVYNTEEYDGIVENNFKEPTRDPLSTFSIDVDAASYSNVRRFLNSGQRPPIDAVRVEEMINYFDYDYADPKDEHPFSVYTEVSNAPWAPAHRLVHI